MQCSQSKDWRKRSTYLFAVLGSRVLTHCRRGEERETINILESKVRKTLYQHKPDESAVTPQASMTLTKLTNCRALTNNDQAEYSTTSDGQEQRRSTNTCCEKNSPLENLQATEEEGTQSSRTMLLLHKACLTNATLSPTLPPLQPCCF